MKDMFAKGLFLFNDENGIGIYVGDKVLCVREPFDYYGEFGIRRIDEANNTGILILRKFSGLWLVSDNGTIKARYGKHTRVKRHWYKL